MGSDSVTIKTATSTTTYAVSSASDIDKNGEVTLSDLAAGDAVTYSLDSTGKTIDTLHAGGEAKNAPGMPSASSGSTSSNNA